MPAKRDWSAFIEHPGTYKTASAATASCQHSWVRRIENIYRVVCERCGVER